MRLLTSFINNSPLVTAKRLQLQKEVKELTGYDVVVSICSETDKDIDNVNVSDLKRIICFEYGVQWEDIQGKKRLQTLLMQDMHLYISVEVISILI
jgi:hypothetical protein